VDIAGNPVHAGIMQTSGSLVGRPACVGPPRPDKHTFAGGSVASIQWSAFGQSGDLDDVYRHHQLDTDSIIAAGLDLLG
jgi:hypothetical protein